MEKSSLSLEQLKELFSKESDVILKYAENIPEFKTMLLSLKNCYQNPAWHAEGAIIENGVVKKCGTVYDHVKLVMMEMDKLQHDWLDMFTAFIHDVGKPVCLELYGCKKGESWSSSKNHDKLGVEPASEICKSLGVSDKDRKTVMWLVEKHMIAHRMMEIESKAERWRIVSHPDFNRLVKLSTCDYFGRVMTAKDRYTPIFKAIKLKGVKELIGKKMPNSLLEYKDLIEIGYRPECNIESILEKAYEIQIDKKIKNKKKLLDIIIKLFKVL